nr:GGDEF domain-containing protein [Burkholderiales bacterium]
VWGCLVAGVLAMAARYLHLPNAVSPGTAFLSLFGAIIVIYAYFLMNRVEGARHRSEQVSRTDALTGLLNRRGLNEAAEGWLCASATSPHPLVVMFADLDNFKMVNDTKGHAEGDRVLVQIATTLRECLRSSDLVARYGGDEFVLLLPEITLGEAAHIARRIQTAVHDWFVDNALSCGISIGFTAVPPAESDLEKVLATVDHLLYRSKAERAGNGIRQVELPDYSVT